MANLPGFAEHGVAAKPLGPFADRWAACCAGRGTGAHRGDRRRPSRGGGTGAGLCASDAQSWAHGGGVGHSTEAASSTVSRAVSGCGRRWTHTASGASKAPRPRGSRSGRWCWRTGREVASDFTIGGRRGPVPHGWLARFAGWRRRAATMRGRQRPFARSATRRFMARATVSIFPMRHGPRPASLPVRAGPDPWRGTCAPT